MCKSVLLDKVVTQRLRWNPCQESQRFQTRDVYLFHVFEGPLDYLVKNKQINIEIIGNTYK